MHKANENTVALHPYGIKTFKTRQQKYFNVPFNYSTTVARLQGKGEHFVLEEFYDLSIIASKTKPYSKHLPNQNRNK